ncbi:hypothetical protein RZU89_10145 (plasmid) [Campylobacter coli]|nr:hypothetical protein [Campylobacter jejuni]
MISSFEFIEKKAEQNQDYKGKPQPNQITPPKEAETMQSIDENQAEIYMQDDENLPF